MKPELSTALTLSGLTAAQAFSVGTTHCPHLALQGLAIWPKLTLPGTIVTFNFPLLLLPLRVVFVSVCMCPHVHCCFFLNKEPALCISVSGIISRSLRLMSNPISFMKPCSIALFGSAFLFELTTGWLTVPLGGHLVISAYI